MALNCAWAPTNERSTTWTFSVAGESAGTILALVGGPYLIHEYNSWKSVFIVSGGIGLIWLLLFLILGSSTPEEHEWISSSELNYILKHRENTTVGTNNSKAMKSGENKIDTHFRAHSAAVYVSLNETSDIIAPSVEKNEFIVNSNTSNEIYQTSKPAIPWRKILCNRPFQITVIAHMCYNYGYYVVLSWIADFFKTEFNANYSKMGFVSMLPYALLFFTSPGGKFNITLYNVFKMY